MSLTAHLASMPRRSVQTVSIARDCAGPITRQRSRVSVVIRRFAKGALMLTGVVLALFAIIAFKAWMWWPQGHY
jgi:hypothetical protein